MLQFQVLTIFPDLFESFSRYGLISRAVTEKLMGIRTLHLRDFAINTHGQIDDTPYGGGSGMVLRPEPATAGIRKAKETDPNSTVVLFTPRGKPLSQQLARDLLQSAEKKNGGFVLLCSRYEGVDERVPQGYVDHEICIGDYVLMGGEVAAMSFMETLARLVPGVLRNPESLVQESFETPFLEYPQYTKPNTFEGREVPPVLLSGNHKEIQAWRDKQSLQDTLERRPDLIVGNQIKLQAELSVALLHYPVKNKQGEIVTSSITNLDLHDIARSAKTFGISRYYVVHPVKTLRKLAHKISEHWSTGYGAQYNPNRSEALGIMQTVPDFQDVFHDVEARTGRLPKLITTSAKPSAKAISFAKLRAVLATSEDPHVILFGTGWGLAPEILERADYHLEPIIGSADYNHLSVRAAAAIVMDRLLGKH